VDPRRFTWVYDESGDTDDCVKVRDDHTWRSAAASRTQTPETPH
jgi:hypothetical protein